MVLGVSYLRVLAQRPTGCCSASMYCSRKGLYSEYEYRRQGAKTIKKNTNSTQNKSQTHRAKQYEVTSFLSTDCELSTETCSKNVYSLGPGFWPISSLLIPVARVPIFTNYVLPSLPERGAGVMHLVCLLVCLSGRVAQKTIAPIDLISLHKKFRTRSSVLL